MAFKLTKAEAAEIERIAELLEQKASDLEDAINAYNEAIQEARDFAENIGQRGDDEWSDKSERWQEGDKGTAAREWVDAWADADFPEADEPDFSASETLRNLPFEMEG